MKCRCSATGASPAMLGTVLAPRKLYLSWASRGWLPHWHATHRCCVSIGRRALGPGGTDGQLLCKSPPSWILSLEYFRGRRASLSESRWWPESHQLRPQERTLRQAAQQACGQEGKKVHLQCSWPQACGPVLARVQLGEFTRSARPFGPVPPSASTQQAGVWFGGSLPPSGRRANRNCDPRGSDFLQARRSNFEDRLAVPKWGPPCLLCVAGSDFRTAWRSSFWDRPR